MTGAYDDPRNLRESAYRTADALARRQSIYQYRRPPLDLVSFALDLVRSPLGDRVLDLGCGNGGYAAGVRARWPSVDVVVADLSDGMVQAAREAAGAAGAVADASRLPFRSGTFGVTLAMHMLYHVPDMRLAAGEIRRVTAATGTALVSTNSVDHLREIKALFAQALVDVRGGPVVVAPTEAERFNLENGAEVLSGAFSDVRRKAAWGTLAIPDAAAVRDYVDSLRALRRDVVPDDGDWAQLLTHVERRAAEVIAARGAFEVATRTGVFVCR